MVPLLGMDQPDNNEAVSYKGLKKEHVLVALWVNASGTGSQTESGEAQLFLTTLQGRAPTFQEASEYLSIGGRVDYFHGRKIAGVFTNDDTYLCHAYNKKHGPQRAQKVVAALRALSSITPQAVAKLYISVLDEVMTRDGALMKELMRDGKTAEAFKIHQCLNVRKDADGTGYMMSSATSAEDSGFVQSIASGFMSLFWGAPKAQEDNGKAASPAAAAAAVKTTTTEDHGNYKGVPLTGDYQTDRDMIYKMKLDELFNRAKPKQG